MLLMGPLIPLKAYLSDANNSNGDIEPATPGQGSPDSPGDSDNPDAKADGPSPLSGSDAKFKAMQLAQLATVGMGTGFLAGLFGVGGGALTVPAVSMICDMNHYTVFLCSAA